MLDKIPFRWPIFNRQTIIDSEELTVLELAGRSAEKVNEVIDTVNGFQGTLDAKENSDDITNNRKLSPTGNFTGTWFGFSNPVASDPGIQAVVNSLLDRTINVYNVMKLVNGAKGDGITNDTTNIQSIIDACGNAGGGIVYFPPNFTFLTDVLTVSGNNVQLFIDHCTLKVASISITGSNSGILGNSGTIDGKLKVAKLVTQVDNGATSLTFDSMPFIVGDGIQSSYGLGSDGSDPIPILTIDGNTVTIPSTFVSSKSGLTQNSVSATIPVNANIGTYTWTATVILQGSGNYLKGLNQYGLSVVNSQGYAIKSIGTGIESNIEDVNIYNNGLDIMQVSGINSRLKMVKSKIGFIYDIAKQGIVMGDGVTNNISPKVYLEDCIINRQNSDPDFFMNGLLNGAEIRAKNCQFWGTNGVHPAGSNNYNSNSYACVSLNANNGSNIAVIEFDGCEHHDYEQGLITEQAGNSINQNVGEIDIKNCKCYNVVLGNHSHSSWNRFDIDGCLFDGQNVKTSAVWWHTNGLTSTVTIRNTKFKNDGTTKNFVLAILKQVIFDHSPFALHETTYADDITVIESPLSTYPSYDNDSILRLKQLTIQHSDFTTNIANAINVLPSGAGDIDFKFLNGTLKGTIFNFNFANYYVVKLKLNNGNYGGLYGDDWNIPVFSEIEELWSSDAATKIKYVSKSAITTLSIAAVSGATSITVASATGIAAGDYINIKLDSGRIHSTKVSAGYAGGTTIPLDAGLASAAALGNNVCDFLF